MHVVALIISALIVWWLYRWTMFAFYDFRGEAFAKPWRPWARLGFSAVLTLLILGAQRLVAPRARLF